MNIRIRNYHLDGYGHVNHARYLEFLEEARWLFFDERNLLPLPANLRLVVARADIRYRRAAEEGSQLHIRNQIKELTARHLVLTQTVGFACNGKNVLEADITLMPVDASSGRATRFPQPLLTTLQTLSL